MATKRKATRKKAPAKRKAGRPTKKTPETVELIMRGLRLGLEYETTAAMAGIAYETLRAWRRADDAFSAECEKAIAGGKASMTAELVKMARAGNVTAAIFWLKRRTAEFKEDRNEALDDARRAAFQAVSDLMAARNQ